MPTQTESSSHLTEKALIGAAMIDATVVVGLATRYGINRDSFTTDAHRILWDCIVDLESQPPRVPGQPNVDPVTMYQHLHDRGQLEAVGGTAALSDITNATPTSAHAPHYVQILHDMHQRSRVRHAASQIKEMTYKPDIPPHEAIGHAMNLLARVFVKPEDKANGEVLTGIVGAWEANNAAVQAGAPRQYMGLPIGFGPIDDILGGVQPGLNIVAGLPSAGKTSFACHAMLNVALRGIPCAAVLMDISTRRTLARLVANHAGVSLAKLNKGHVYDKQWETVKSSAATLSALPIHFLENEDDLDTVCAWLRTMKALHKIEFFILDYLQLLSPRELRREPEAEQLKHVTRRLKKLSLELQLPGLVLAQFNRGSEKEQRDPRLSDLHGASAIEKEATVALLLSEWKKYPYPPNPDHEHSHKKRRAVKVIVAKQQDGETADFPFWLRGPYFKFEVADPRWGLSEEEFEDLKGGS